jgi:hypothetical protein
MVAARTAYIDDARSHPASPGHSGAIAQRALNALLPGWCQTETALLPAPFWVHLPRGTGPLRLALAGATRSGSAGVGSLARDPLARLRRIQVESTGTTINFRPAAITHRDIGLAWNRIQARADGGRGCVLAVADRSAGAADGGVVKISVAANQPKNSEEDQNYNERRDPACECDAQRDLR